MERLLAKATPGEWLPEYDGRGYALGIACGAQHGVPGGIEQIVRQRGFGFPSSEQAQANMESICSMHNAAPRLLASLAASRAREERYREALIEHAVESCGTNGAPTGQRYECLICDAVGDTIDGIQHEAGCALAALPSPPKET